MNIAWYCFIFFTIIGLDRWTKLWALTNLTVDDLLIFPGFNLSLAWNRGISWGIFHSNSPVVFWGLLVFIIFIILVLAWYTFYWQFCCCRTSIFWELLVLGGAVSNIIDRVVYGAVIDFIQLYVKDFYWPTFNVADMFVVVGIIGMFLKSMVNCHDEQNKRILL